MSHRRSATSADKHFAALDAALSIAAPPERELSTGDAYTYAYARNFGMPDIGNNPRDAMLHAHGLHRRVRSYVAHDLALWSRWRTCRHVYRFDRALSRELRATPLPDSMPLDALAMLPYPIVYVDAPLPAIGFDAVGAFAWLDHATDGTPTLCTVLVLDDGCHQDNILSLTADNLGDAVDKCVRYDLNFAGVDLGTLIGCDYAESARRMYAAVLNHLLYIASDAQDQEIEYRPSTGARKQRRNQSSSTIHAVGTVTGRALGAARVAYVGGSSGDGTRSVRPHVRAAHYHHYWTGPRADPAARQLVVHWIAPTFVGGSAGDAPTTVHRV